MLKQDRLTPLPAVFQLAWLIAFNAGLLDEFGVDDLEGILAALQKDVESSTLTLDSPREEWLEHLLTWLEMTAERES